MNTFVDFLDYLVVLAVAALLLGPSLYWAGRERRLERQIRAAGQDPRAVRDRHRREPAPGRTPGVTVRVGRGPSRA
ncbi:hypothetical protein J7E97_11305 [Streptomyces sp. ISL-66]|uniref:hypothetical protein n=1 Tax=Streptomyces sp. ISL-66 TaxID=2819186 RepID=UPI001BEAC6B2|nr:hypothetical protein [Streptomyces sp. ISL-66]MBT2468448.1 hypothetical protein [Streptomyces sp. ISL-66]